VAFRSAFEPFHTTDSGQVMMQTVGMFAGSGARRLSSAPHGVAHKAGEWTVVYAATSALAWLRIEDQPAQRLQLRAGQVRRAGVTQLDHGDVHLVLSSGRAWPRP
jgi:hypothetical protein